MSNEIKKIDNEVQWPAVIKDKESLKQAMSPAILRASLRNVDTPIKAYQSDTPSLAVIAKEHGEGFCKNRLYEMFDTLEKYLGNQFDLSKEQKVMLIEDILDSFYALNIADVQLVLRRIMHGECGKIYGKITCSYIFDAFKSYYQERTNDVAESHRNQEESIAKHGYDRSKAPSATEQEVFEMYKERQMQWLQEQRRLKLADIQNKTHLKDLLNKFEDERHRHNG